MNTTVMSVTRHSLLGGRRLLMLLGLPAVLLALTLLVRALAPEGELDPVLAVVGLFGLGTLMPLLGLIAGTGSIGPEIDDASIVYLLAKPIKRSRIIVSKLVVAIATVVALGVLPIALSGLLLDGAIHPLTSSFTVAALVAAVTYSSLFLMLATITRNAVVIGLMYALVWESLVGSFVPGAQTLSIQQWAIAIGEQVAGDDASRLGFESAVDLSTAIVALVLVTATCIIVASRRLSRIHLTHEA